MRHLFLSLNGTLWDGRDDDLHSRHVANIYLSKCPSGEVIGTSSDQYSAVGLLRVGHDVAMGRSSS